MMKNLSQHTRRFTSALACMAIVVAAGCGSSEKKAVDRTETAAKSLDHLRDQVAKAQAQTKKTLTALDATIAAPPTDLKKAFLDFTKEHDKLKSEAMAVRKDVEQLEKRTAEHFAKWETEMAEVTSPEIREAAAKRRAQVQAAMGRVKAEFEATRGAFQPLSTELQDIATFLANDLTPGGVDAIRDLAKKSHEDAAQVNDRIASLTKEIDDLAGMIQR